MHWACRSANKKSKTFSLHVQRRQRVSAVNYDELQGFLTFTVFNQWQRECTERLLRVSPQHLGRETTCTPTMTSYPEAWVREDKQNLTLAHIHTQTTERYLCSGGLHQRCIFRQSERVKVIVWESSLHRRWSHDEVFVGGDYTSEQNIRNGHIYNVTLKIRKGFFYLQGIS